MERHIHYGRCGGGIYTLWEKTVESYTDYQEESIEKKKIFLDLSIASDASLRQNDGQRYIVQLKLRRVPVHGNTHSTRQR